MPVVNSRLRNTFCFRITGENFHIDYSVRMRLQCQSSDFVFRLLVLCISRRCHPILTITTAPHHQLVSSRSIRGKIITCTQKKRTRRRRQHTMQTTTAKTKTKPAVQQSSSPLNVCGFRVCVQVSGDAKRRAAIAPNRRDATTA